MVHRLSKRMRRLLGVTAVVGAGTALGAAVTPEANSATFNGIHFPDSPTAYDRGYAMGGSDTADRGRYGVDASFYSSNISADGITGFCNNYDVMGPHGQRFHDPHEASGKMEGALLYAIEHNEPKNVQAFIVWETSSYGDKVHPNNVHGEPARRYAFEANKIINGNHPAYRGAPKITFKRVGKGQHYVQWKLQITNAAGIKNAHIHFSGVPSGGYVNVRGHKVSNGQGISVYPNGPNGHNGAHAMVTLHDDKEDLTKPGQNFHFKGSVSGDTDGNIAIANYLPPSRTTQALTLVKVTTI